MKRIKYPCHLKTQQGDVKKHIHSLYEKIKYSRNKCDHQATQQGNLKIRIQSIHVEVAYHKDMLDMSFC